MTLLVDDREATETAAPEGEAAARVIVTYAEEYRCPACESVLPVECVRRDPPTTDQMRRGQRTISIYCPHCNAGWEGLFRLGEGLLHPLAVTRLDDPDVDRVKLDYEQYHRTVRSRPADPAAERELAELGQRILATEAQLAGLRQARRDVARRAAGRVPPPAGGQDLDVGGLSVVDEPPPPHVEPPDLLDEPARPAPPVPTAEQIAEQMRRIDRDVDQRNEWSESEPGPDYLE